MLQIDGSSSCSHACSPPSLPLTIRRFTARALHCLNRVGPTLILELTNLGLILRCLSQSQSSYAHFSFPYTFFDRWSVHDDTLAERVRSHNEELVQTLLSRQQQQHAVGGQPYPPPAGPPMRVMSVVKCRLSIKMLLHAFRNCSNVASLQVIVDIANDTATFAMTEEETRIRRTYKFALEVSMKLQ